ncbi:hypothetical protein KDRO_D04740 [Kluyveromyces lactis]|nr:hypothetical protein KDRO_D04740 [Kluyveromyces lactis]
MVIYPDSFPYYNDLVNVVHELDGTITHEYTLFNGFSLDLPEEFVSKFKEMNQHFNWGLEIEEDQEVHALGGLKEHAV